MGYTDRLKGWITKKARYKRAFPEIGASAEI